MNKIIVAVLLLIGLFCGLSACVAPLSAGVFSPEAPGRLVFLVAGLDDAAENTDVLLLCSFSEETGQVYAVQVPRDTYDRFGKGQNKLNQYYAHMRASGKSETESIHALSGHISDRFGIRIDGAVGFTTAAFRNAVDAVGGVDIRFAKDFVYGTGDGRLAYAKGEHHFDGKEAERFVRYRKGYAMGDLGRMDAQKLFLSAFFGKLRSGFRIDELLNIATRILPDTVTDMPKKEMLSLALRYGTQAAGAKVSFLTLPGEAASTGSGLWYFCVNRKAAVDVMRRCLFATGDRFDPDRRLTDGENLTFINIYDDRSIRPEIYSEETLRDLQILSE